MAKIVFLDNLSEMGGGSGGAWDETSVGVFGVGLPGTWRHKVYEMVDSAGSVVNSVTETAKATFSFMSFAKENWKLLSIGAVALIVLLKD